VTVLLIRHAVAKDRHRWEGDDDLRPLTARGRKQAELLVEQLAAFAVSSLLSSPSVRCVDTVAPLAAARRLSVEVDDVLGEGTGRGAVAFVERLLDAGADAALCSHGDVIPEVLDALRIDWDRCAKGSTWVLESRSKATYLPPPA
jgi:8-oxo-(d)GTP phosphatase